MFAVSGAKDDLRVTISIHDTLKSAEEAVDSYNRKGECRRPLIEFIPLVFRGGEREEYEFVPPDRYELSDPGSGHFFLHEKRRSSVISRSKDDCDYGQVKRAPKKRKFDETKPAFREVVMDFLLADKRVDCSKELIDCVSKGISPESTINRRLRFLRKLSTWASYKKSFKEFFEKYPEFNE